MSARARRAWLRLRCRAPIPRSLFRSSSCPFQLLPSSGSTASSSRGRRPRCTCSRTPFTTARRSLKECALTRLRAGSRSSACAITRGGCSTPPRSIESRSPTPRSRSTMRAGRSSPRTPSRAAPTSGLSCSAVMARSGCRPRTIRRSRWRSRPGNGASTSATRARSWESMSACPPGTASLPIPFPPWPRPAATIFRAS